MEVLIITRPFQQWRSQYENTLLHTHITCSNVMLILPSTFLQSIYFLKKMHFVISHIYIKHKLQHVSAPKCHFQGVTITKMYVPTCYFIFVRSYMIYLLTAIGLSPGGRSTVHIYTQTIHRTIRSKQ